MPIPTSLKAITPTSSAGLTPMGIVKPTPSIAVAHSQTAHLEEKTPKKLSRPKSISPNKRKDIKKQLQQKVKPTGFDKRYL